MLLGTTDDDTALRYAPSMRSTATEPLPLGPTTVITSVHEQVGARETLFPPALHPTVPVIIRSQFWDAPEAPGGPVRLAMVSLSCRSGLRPRSLLAGAVVEAPDATVESLSGGWGFPATTAEIDIRAGYDASSGTVRLDGEEVLSIDLVDPSPLSVGDIQFFSALHPARLPRGGRLAQVDIVAEVSRAERTQPRLRTFRTDGWISADVAPGMAVTATVVRADLTLQPVRFLNRLDVGAFEGTEKVS